MKSNTVTSTAPRCRIWADHVGAWVETTSTADLKAYMAFLAKAETRDYVRPVVKQCEIHGDHWCIVVCSEWDEAGFQRKLEEIRGGAVA